ncbi:MAG: hypothetical protein GY944_11530 [bacterium]|nr:hypothetical protein [bacterium]
MKTKTTEVPFRPLTRKRFPPGSLLALALLTSCAGVTDRGDGRTVPPDDVVCFVNSGEILRSDVEARKHKLLPTARYHGNVSAAEQQAMRRSALQSLIDDELEFQDAHRRGLGVDHTKVEKEYARVVERYGGTASFEARIRHSGIKAKEIRAALEREFLIALVKERVADDQAEISEDEARRYFAEHADRFRLPRRAHVSQILVYMPPLERDPEDWKRAVDEALALRSRVEAGESFPELAEGRSQASEDGRVRGGAIRLVHPGQLEPLLDEPLWTLRAGEVSAPIRAFKGVYLLWVERFVEPQAMAYEEIEEQLEALLQQRRREQALKDWLGSLRARAEIEIVDPTLAPDAGE